MHLQLSSPVFDETQTVALRFVVGFVGRQPNNNNNKKEAGKQAPKAIPRFSSYGFSWTITNMFLFFASLYSWPVFCF